ncbi:hypothetical protein SNEBB_009677 [Seison nebaliae]|nr:hypothetical protein SNEBB_009677 [Seison nebaliae]
MTSEKIDIDQISIPTNHYYTQAAILRTNDYMESVMKNINFFILVCNNDDDSTFMNITIGCNNRTLENIIVESFCPTKYATIGLPTRWMISLVPLDNRIKRNQITTTDRILTIRLNPIKTVHKFLLVNTSISSTSAPKPITRSRKLVDDIKFIHHRQFIPNTLLIFCNFEFMVQRNFRIKFLNHSIWHEISRLFETSRMHTMIIEKYLETPTYEYFITVNTVIQQTEEEYHDFLTFFCYNSSSEIQGAQTDVQLIISSPLFREIFARRIEQRIQLDIYDMNITKALVIIFKKPYRTGKEKKKTMLLWIILGSIIASILFGLFLIYYLWEHRKKKHQVQYKLLPNKSTMIMEGMTKNVVTIDKRYEVSLR